mgnify:CR=1 FL=1
MRPDRTQIELMMSAKSAIRHFLVILGYVEGSTFDIIEAAARNIYEIQARMHLDHLLLYAPATEGNSNAY